MLLKKVGYPINGFTEGTGGANMLPGEGGKACCQVSVLILFGPLLFTHCIVA
jgi:hypothetical protein